MLRLDFSPVRQDANVVGGVFHFDPAQHTTRWCSDYSLSIGLIGNASVSGRLFCLPVTQVEVDPAVDLAQAHIPALEPFRLDGHFTGSDGSTLAYASHEPSGAAGAPLVVWLHSGEEYGTDVRIPLLAEKVTALAGDAFQKALGGAAFVLVPQTTEAWSAAQAPVLQELIEQFAAGHPGVDTRRILLGGSGAGGAMTLQMLLHAPDFFAAAFPSARPARTLPFQPGRSQRWPKRPSGSPMQRTGSPPTPASTPPPRCAACRKQEHRSI